MTPWHPYVTLPGELNYPPNTVSPGASPEKEQTIILCGLYIGPSIDNIEDYINTKPLEGASLKIMLKHIIYIIYP